LNEYTEESLNEISRRSRITTLVSLNISKSPHIGSCFSVIEILVAAFGFKLMNDGKKDVDVLLSKGHAAAALYSVLYEFGRLTDSDLKSFSQDNTHIYGHVDNLASPLIPLATGSLGHGLPYALGLALAAKIENRSNQVSIVVLSDGELNEGTTWESLLIANQLKLSNLILIVDRNRLQSFKGTEETLSLEPLSEKFLNFGFEVLEVDGHDITALLKSLVHSEKPKCIIANTVKGHGVSFMENSVLWHYKPPLDEDFNKALKELQSQK
jgi:transketolase